MLLRQQPNGFTSITPNQKKHRSQYTYRYCAIWNADEIRACKTHVTISRWFILYDLFWLDVCKYRWYFSVQLKVLLDGTLHLGLCLPKSCTNDHIHQLLQELFSSRQVGEPAPKVLRVKDLDINSSFLLKKSVLLFVAMIILIKFLKHAALRMERSEKRLEDNNIAGGVESRVKKSVFWNIVQCFNGKESESKKLPSISGLKQVTNFIFLVQQFMNFHAI